MFKGGPITRRTVLKGLGTTVALPFLEVMLPKSAIMAGSASQASAPRRMAFIYVPNGMHMNEFTPSAEGALPNTLPHILEPLAQFRNDFSVLSGLTADKARPNGDGPGDHARAAASYLTGVHPRKTAGADIQNGISVDQVAAQHIGSATRFASL